MFELTDVGGVGKNLVWSGQVVGGFLRYTDWISGLCAGGCAQGIYCSRNRQNIRRETVSVVGVGKCYHDKCSICDVGILFKLWVRQFCPVFCRRFLARMTDYTGSVERPRTRASYKSRP